MPLADTALSLVVGSRSVAETAQAYRDISPAMRQRFHAAINALDPRIGMTHTMHLAHNWHRCGGSPNENTEQIIAIMARYDRLSSWLSRRQDAEWHRAEHRRHLRDREAGRYLWCGECKAYAVEQKANRQPRLPLRAPRRKATARP
jgi:hypothetical protein